ncbi:hypothetical protein A4H97_11745 [Niastella yeongjuensis]|uniref:PKD-like family protein n=1 Tax=Niastella yeongjuensis TaxID=354355 RepID=A0A1V9EA79_9BACT|nr:PKD-like family lipoprotein [Niastella yeongjuensis]OQP42825.1 hypothetical protein A4H97_11745 [Niastella yeongjuensis]SEO55666.1 PKD-like family protein [Niastella yeongjuensis]
MKRLLLVMLAAVALLQLACYKDKGNYDYHPVVEPGIGVDSLYKVPLGQNLVIAPQLTTTDANSRFGLSWRLGIPKKVWDTTLYGPTFSYNFTMDPDVYPVLLTITDSSNGMKYFRNFNVQITTPYTTGTLVLSNENNISQLSFIQPDNTVLPRVYRTLNGEDLPGHPLQVFNPVKLQINPVPALGYWATFGDTDDGGVHIGTNSMLKINTLRTNFFTRPAKAKPGYLETTGDGVLQGVINGKMYQGTWQTFYGADVYGFFGEPANGDYEAYARVVKIIDLISCGYDINRKKIIAFTYMGAFAYAPTYQVDNTTEFDPQDLKLDMLFLHSISEHGYAFGKAADGSVYELKFTAAYRGYVLISPEYKHTFPQPALITPTTKWAGSLDGKVLFYFTSGDKIYRYDPAIQDLRPLAIDFGGKNVTMIKLKDNTTMIAGVEGSLYYIDIDSQELGTLIKKIDGIPGDPIDVAERQ